MPLNTQTTRLRLFGTGSLPIKETGKIELWIIRVYFFLLSIGTLSMIALFIMYFDIMHAHFHDVFLVLTVIAFSLITIFSIYRMNFYGAMILPLCKLVVIILSSMRVIDDPITPQEVIAALSGAGAAYLVWRVRNKIKL